MRSILNKFVLVPAMMAVATFAVTSATAATLNVPFNFTVAGKTCPAGEYSVERKAIGSNFVTLKSMDARTSFHWALGPGDPAPNDARVVLKFDEQGDAHTLRSVQYGPMIAKALDNKSARSERATTRWVQGQ